MQVHNVQSNNYTSYNSLNFGKLNLTEPGEKLIKSLPEGAEILQKIDIWKNELAETKFFDLEIDELCKRLFITIKSKYSDWMSCEAPLKVSEAYDDEPKGKKFSAYGTDLLDCGDWVTYPLKFATNKDAETAYYTLKRHHNHFPINNVAWAVDSVKILEKAFENMYPKMAAVSHSTEEMIPKTPFIQRLKNAWQALKG